MKVDPNDFAAAILRPQDMSCYDRGLENSFEHFLAAASSRAVRASGNLSAAVVAPRSELQERREVFGFGELGVFGRYGTREGEGPIGATCKKPVSSVMVTDQTREIQNQAKGRLAAELPLAGSSIEPGATDVEPLTSSETAGPASRADLADAAGQALPNDIALLEQSLQASGEDGSLIVNDGQAANIPQCKNNILPVSISVAGTDDALNIVARSGSQPEDHSKLQRMIEDTATEFGMQVDELKLDGSSLRSFRSIVGGNSGSRIR